MPFFPFVETRPRAGLRPAGPRWIVGRVHFSRVHFSRLALRLRRSARRGQFVLRKTNKTFLIDFNHQGQVHYLVKVFWRTICPLRAERRRRKARREKCTYENCTLPTINLGPAGRRPALGLVSQNTFIFSAIWLSAKLLEAVQCQWCEFLGTFQSSSIL